LQKMRNMRKLTLLYYEVFDFQPDTMRYMEDYFNIVILESPEQDTDEILESVEVCFAPMGFLFDRSKIEKCKELQVIATPTTGVLHIDLDFAQKRNITICSLKDQQDFLLTITPTPELTWGLVLAVTRYIPWAHESVCAGKWDGKAYGRRTPKMLSEMSLGIIGLGRIGSLMASYGRSFQMRVLYYDPYVTDNRYEKCHNLNDLAKASDIVSVHVHLSEKTKNLVDREFMETLSKGSYVINTARGGVVDEDALLELLLSEHLAGAGLDMLADEHLPDFQEKLKAHPLVKYANSHDNLILTPKMGGCTIDAWQSTERHLLDMVIEELSKRGKM